MDNISNKTKQQMQLIKNINLYNPKYIDMSMQIHGTYLSAYITTERHRNFNAIDQHVTKCDKKLNKNNRSILFESHINYMYKSVNRDGYFDGCWECRENMSHSILMYAHHQTYSNIYPKIFSLIACITNKKYFVPKDILILILEYLFDIRVNICTIEYCKCKKRNHKAVIYEKIIIEDETLESFIKLNARVIT